jgi:hypothetical protein
MTPGTTEGFARASARFCALTGGDGLGTLSDEPRIRSERFRWRVRFRRSDWPSARVNNPTCNGEHRLLHARIIAAREERIAASKR